jgi:hypothetical protein
MSRRKEEGKSIERELKRATRGQPKIYPAKQGAYRWLVSWRHKGKRERYFYRTKLEAEEKQKELLRTIRHEGAEGVHFGAEARSEYAAARKILGPYGVTILEAARDYAKRHRDRSHAKAWEDAVFELVEALERGNRREATIHGLQRNLGAFQDYAKPETLADFNRENSEAFLNSGRWKPATVASYRAALSNLGNFCTRQGWIAENPVEKIFPPRLDRGHPVCYTISEANALLGASARIAGGRILGRLSLLLLMGLRPTEIDSLQPSDFRVDGLRVGTGKLRGRRSVRFIRYSPAFRAWWENSSKEISPPNFRKIYEAAKLKAGIEKTGTKIERHTWISCKLAVCRDENETAREAGNSPDVIFNDYFQIINEDDAAQLGAWSPLDNTGKSLTLGK